MEKKLKEQPILEIESCTETSDPCFIDTLPPEMLMHIVQYLNDKSILTSRLVSRQWNEIARGILQSRKHVEIGFRPHKAENGSHKICGSNKKTECLEQFIKCFKNSNEMPVCTRFILHDIEYSFFDHANWKTFVSLFGKNVKCLKLEVNNIGYMDFMTQLAERLRNLLLNQLPKLQEFGLHISHNPTLQIPHSRSSDTALAYQRLELFPKASNYQTPEITLPYLNVLYLDENLFSECTEIATDLLRSSTNLKKLLPLRNCHLDSFQTFQLLHSLGKLCFLQAAFIYVHPELLLEFQTTPYVVTTFELKELHLLVSPICKNESPLSDVAEFLSNLFESIKDTVNRLVMQPLGFLTDLRLPKFSKLTSLLVWDVEESKVPLLPKGRKMDEIFPLLEFLDLKLSWTEALPQIKDTFCLPNLKSIKIPGTGLTETEIEQISYVCPNLNDLKIVALTIDDTDEAFPEVTTAIWTHLKKLKSLVLILLLESSEVSFHGINSCFTGFSKDVCILLNDLFHIEELLKSHGSQIKISKTDLEVERFPSILELRELKKLTIWLFEDDWEDDMDSGLSKKVLKVSEKYAFQMMENLTYEIHKFKTEELEEMVNV